MASEKAEEQPELVSTESDEDLEAAQSNLSESGVRLSGTRLANAERARRYYWRNRKAILARRRAKYWADAPLRAKKIADQKKAREATKLAESWLGAA